MAVVSPEAFEWRASKSLTTRPISAMVDRFTVVIERTISTSRTARQARSVEPCFVWTGAGPGRYLPEGTLRSMELEHRTCQSLSPPWDQTDLQDISKWKWDLHPWKSSGTSALRITRVSGCFQHGLAILLKKAVTRTKHEGLPSQRL